VPRGGKGKRGAEKQRSTNSKQNDPGDTGKDREKMQKNRKTITNGPRHHHVPSRRCTRAGSSRKPGQGIDAAVRNVRNAVPLENTERSRCSHTKHKDRRSSKTWKGIDAAVANARIGVPEEKYGQQFPD
jgi:hypothetical protein